MRPHNSGVIDCSADEFFSARILPRLEGSAASAGPAVELGRGVLIYGAGDLGSLAIQYCENCGIKIAGLLDRHKRGAVAGRLGQYPVAGPDENFGNGDLRQLPVLVAVATSPFTGIRDSLYLDGWKYVFPFYQITEEDRDGHPLQNGWRLGDVSLGEREEIAQITRRWADAWSRSHYEAFIAWHCNQDEVSSVRYPIESERRYVITPMLEYLAKRRGELVDVGAHLGEAVRRFERSGVLFERYCLVEPDELSSAQLAKALVGVLGPETRLRVVTTVLGSGRTRGSFQSGLGYCSQIWEQARDTRDVVPLDDLDLTPDVVKIHTEGSEFDILEGAKRTLQKCRPAVVMSVYHTRAGVCEGTAGVMRMLEGYKFFFRLHSYQGTGAFLYAIPE